MRQLLDTELVIKKKKPWARPVIYALSIKRDTFSGSGTGVEFADKAGPPGKR